jgi:hypothetical protein
MNKAFILVDFTTNFSDRINTVTEKQPVEVNTAANSFKLYVTEQNSAKSGNVFP